MKVDYTGAFSRQNALKNSFKVSFKPDNSLLCDGTKQNMKIGMTFFKVL